MKDGKGTSNYDRQVDIARGIFLQYDQTRLIEKYRLPADEDYLYLSYLGGDFRICRKTGQIDERQENWVECRNFSTVMTLYDLLCFHRGDTLPALSGVWQTVGSFVVSGVQDTGRFTAEFAADFDRLFHRLPTACEGLGGICLPSVAGADLSCRFPVTDFFPVLLQFWRKDEEFPPQITLLWDERSMEYLHFETTFYLQGDLLERIRRQL